MLDEVIRLEEENGIFTSMFGEIETQPGGSEILKTLFDKPYSHEGYIENKNGIFIFYNIEFKSVLILPEILNDNNPHYVWCLIDEICNQKKKKFKKENQKLSCCIDKILSPNNYLNC